ALNRFITDADEGGDVVRAVGAAEGVEVVRCDGWEKGGEGGAAVAESLLGLLKTSKTACTPMYHERPPIRETIETTASASHGGGADGAGLRESQGGAVGGWNVARAGGQDDGVSGGHGRFRANE